MGLSSCRPTVAEIDLDACVRNLRALRELAGERELWPVVKADAYGHGALRVTRALARERIAGFCVATASEGRELRQGGIGQPILVMAGLAEGGAEDAFEIAVEYGLTCGLGERGALERLAATSRRLGIGPVPVHLKVDTGMGRLGAAPERAVEIACGIDDEPALALDGLFSNLATADSVDEPDGAEWVQRQVEVFERLVEELEAVGVSPRHRTLANTAGMLNHPACWRGDAFTGTRPGIALYGATLNPGEAVLRLRPAMRLLTRIAEVRQLPEGAGVGYGHAHVTRRPTRLGVLPVGYHDGLAPALGDRGQVLVRGRRVPVIGRISMDMTLVDVTDVSSAASGDEVVLFGSREPRADEPEERGSGLAAAVMTAMAAADEREHDEAPAGTGFGRGPIRVEEVAHWTGSIPHEILSRIGTRVPRRYLGEAR